MKQEIAAEKKSTSPAPPPRFRAPPKTMDSPRSEHVNGAPPGLKTRPKSALPETNSTQKARRSLGINKLKSGEDSGPQKGREMEETKSMSRPGNRPVEQYARLGRRLDPNCKRIEDDSDGKRKELQERLDVSENLVKDLQSEISVLKAQLEKLQSLNVELESQKRQFAKDLAAAEMKISALECNKKESVVEEVPRPNFRDVQKLIANKLEHVRVKKEAIKDQSTSMTQSAVLEPVGMPTAIQPKVSTNAPPSPPPPLPPRHALPSMNAPPPPPPLPPRHALPKAATMRKAPALVEFYHSLTKRAGRKDAFGTGNCSKPIAANAHSSIVGEIQNRSAHLLAIKADIETKGDFIKFLIEKVRAAAYTDIEDVLTFVDWLDGELSSLADERSVLKHFDWPEKKADAMREAAFEYRDLKRLQIEISSYEDDSSMPCEAALKKMASLLDKSERSINRLIKLRDMTMPSYKDCKIPTEWMLNSGMVSEIKLASLKLAKLYLKRVLMELESIQHTEKESAQEMLLRQCVRFAYRAHQFVGGLDSETMCAFEDIRQRVLMHGGGS
ncbi:protein CHUP1, chloroplastic-like isoform X2 [Magnolia sinica]|uniref:protein CHUP1, chloroplastic-like isoform X2 n=1 Tax=Magnolia sinica TaxID=86752 RepID=UPI002658CAAF|nr:protein CHUP1, chloroplastic-like isoform X2 [Magnolia sinica]